MVARVFHVGLRSPRSDSPQVGAVQPRAHGKLVLREPARLAQEPDRAAERLEGGGVL